MARKKIKTPSIKDALSGKFEDDEIIYSQEELKKLSYSDKLKDSRWQELRKIVINRDEYKCRSCGDDSLKLNVHHIHYKNVEPWEYCMNELITLCDCCHSKIHEIIYLGDEHWINRHCSGMKLNVTEFIILSMIVGRVNKYKDSNIVGRLISELNGRLD